MANTYTQLYVQYVFSVKGKENMVKEEYLSFLNKFDVDYDPKYLFEWYENI